MHECVMAKSGGIKREYVRERDRESDNCTEEEEGGGGEYTMM